MRASILLIPAVAAAAVAVASAPPGQGNDMMDVNAFDMSDLDMDSALAATGPAWLSGGEWIFGGAEENGARWYIDLRTSDLEARPMRIMARTDESEVEGSRYGFIEREMTVDCGKYRYRIERTRHYDRDGRAAGPEQRGGGPLIMAEVESIEAAVAHAVCTHDTITEEMYGNISVMNGM